jgi:hypothetical protein
MKKRKTFILAILGFAKYFQANYLTTFKAK